MKHGEGCNCTPAEHFADALVLMKMILLGELPIPLGLTIGEALHAVVKAADGYARQMHEEEMALVLGVLTEGNGEDEEPVVTGPGSSDRN